MKYFKHIRFAACTLTIFGILCAAPHGLMADTRSPCGQTVATDAKAVSADLSAIAAQAGAQGFQAAVEQFASDLETIVPTLNPPSQAAVEKFVTDLVYATSAASPGGTAISPSERLILSNDWVILVTSTGATSADLTTISDDFAAVLGTLKGISTAQLQSDVNVLVADAKSCVTAH